MNKKILSSMMGRMLLSFLLLFPMALSVSAQETARKFRLSLSADGEAQLFAYLPSSPIGRAVVDCPGGGYAHLAMEHEGHQWADYFNRQGIAFFVLKYRMPHGDRSLPIGDAEAAMRLVRDSAAVWGVNPHDVGIMGFSAGGHLASTLSTHAPLAARPDFSILFYPVITMNGGAHSGSRENLLGKHPDKQLLDLYSNETQVRVHRTPPAILIMANDDKAVPPVENGVAYYSAMRRVGNACTMLIYPSGGHGFGFRSSWPYHELMLSELTAWLHQLPSSKVGALRVACIGNSITEGYGIPMASQNGYPAVLQSILGNGYLVKNFGVSSRTMLNKGDYPYMKEPAFRDALDFCPDVAIVKLGTNDSKPENWRYGSELAADMQTLIDSLKALPSKPKIFLTTPIPAFKSTWNISDSVITTGIIPVIRKLAKKNKCMVIDLHTLFAADGDKMLPDGIHPNAEGARKMAEIIARELSQKDRKRKCEK